MKRLIIMHKAIATLNVSVEIECPHCENLIDLFDLDDMRDDGHLWEIIERWRVNNGWKNVNEEITCPECKKIFIFDELEY